MPKGDQPGWRPHTYVHTDSRTHVRALARSSCVHGEKNCACCASTSCHCCRLCQLSRVCQLYQAACAPYVRVRTYVRTHVFQYARRYVRTYVRSSQRRVMCARCARSRQYVRYVRAHVRSSHSRVMCASCARSRKCVRTYVRTSRIRAMNVRTYVRTYVCQLS
jgi:hypothetical protein